MKTCKKLLPILLAVLMCLSCFALCLSATAEAEFKLTYDANGGINAPSSQTYTKGGIKNVSTTSPTREGYTFLGWSLDPEDWEAQVEAGGTIEVNGRVTIYAVWKNNAAAPYKLTYDANEGINAPSAQTYNKGGEKSISTFQPTREGYSFLGWSKDPNASEAQYQPGGTIKVNDRITLYAIWERIVYKLTYDANGGINPPSAQTYTKGGEKNVSTFKPTREGYTFLGWSTDPNATEAQVEAGGKINVNGRVTLYAVWQKDIAPENPGSQSGESDPEPAPQGSCKYCGGTHTGFPGVLIGFFHRILALFGLRK